MTQPTSIQTQIEDAIASHEAIPPDRKSMLFDFAKHISSAIRTDGIAKVNFICTHNSRRSHLSHIWAHVAANHFGISELKTYSGGTEATECNPRTIQALQRAGFQVTVITEPPNPKYEISFAKGESSILVFSKVYHDTAAGNPNADYIAGMCCDDVDQRCPIVVGATTRIALHYRDPKIADGTVHEADTYDERSQQIAQEMFYLMGQVK